MMLDQERLPGPAQLSADLLTGDCLGPGAHGPQKMLLLRTHPFTAASFELNHLRMSVCLMQSPPHHTHIRSHHNTITKSTHQRPLQTQLPAESHKCQIIRKSGHTAVNTIIPLRIFFNSIAMLRSGGILTLGGFAKVWCPLHPV